MKILWFVTFSQDKLTDLKYPLISKSIKMPNHLLSVFKSIFLRIFFSWRTVPASRIKNEHNTEYTLRACKVLLNDCKEWRWLQNYKCWCLEHVLWATIWGQHTIYDIPTHCLVSKCEWKNKTKQKQFFSKREVRRL